MTNEDRNRLSAIMTADRIVVLEDGKAREQGTHSQLLSIEGKYAELWSRQADFRRSSGFNEVVLRNDRDTGPTIGNALVSTAHEAQMTPGDHRKEVSGFEGNLPPAPDTDL